MWRTRLKMPAVMTTGVVITVALFGVMNFLISASPGAMGSSATNPAIRFAAIKLEQPPPPKTRSLPKKPEPAKKLPRPDNPVATRIDPPVSQPTPNYPGRGFPVAPGGQNWTPLCGNRCSLQNQNGDVVALVRIQPNYPRRAALMGVEGWR